MFKKLEIDNFKSLVNFSMEFTPMTVIIGNNASGKSSILQAIDFLCNCVKEDFSVVIERRGWNVENIKSKLNASNNKIHFKSEIELTDSQGRENIYVWELTISAFSGKNLLELHSEKISKKENGEILLEYVAGKKGFIQGKKEIIPIPSSFTMNSSVMKNIADATEADEGILQIKRFLLNSTSFELLSPAEMRLSSRGSADTIGRSGKNLPSFIKKMDEDKKKRFMEKLQFVLGERITDVETQTKGTPGWTQINVKEKYKDRSINVNSKELSDGMLRVLAFIAISEISESNAVMLLDEIENGINSNYAESLLKILSKIYEESGHQLVMTTHSTVFLDYVDKDSIVYLYRNEAGETRAAKLFGTDAMREQLEYMWPGEVILNMTSSAILDRLMSK